MKKLLLLILLPVLIAVGCGREAEETPESGLYKRYASHEELSVAQVCGFSLCDSVRVDVVLLQAESDEAWQQLKEEFDIRGDEGTVSWLGAEENPALRTQWTGSPATRVVASHARRTVGLYIIESEAQYDALLDYQLNKLKNE